MVKVLIKKNVKPKTTKQKQKQKQTQKTNVVVNIGSEVIKKKRGRPTRRSKLEKQTTKPASQQPITQSYNQPIFKQSTPQQPSTLASSILATQDKPKVVKEDVKEESTIRKALIDQDLQTVDPITKKNDLERVKVERIRKPKIEVIKEEPIRHALFSQMLSDQQDYTEEIEQIIKLSKPPTTPFNDNELIPLRTVRFDEPKINPLVSFSPSTEPVLLSQENKQPDLLSSIEEIAQPAEIQQEAPLLYEEGEDQQITQPAEIQQEASLLYEEGEDQQIAPSIVEANDAIKMVQDAMKKTEDKTILEPVKSAATILETPQKVKTLVSNQGAEEQFTEIKSVDGPSSDVIDNALTTPPRYTKEQINKLRVIPKGEVITAEKVKDPEGRKLVFNGQRVFREGKLGQQINLPELRSILKSHYGFDD